MRLLLLIGILFWSGCSSLSEDKTADWSVEQLYFEANADREKGAYSSARDLYTKLLARYPYGKYAQQSLLDLIRLEFDDKEYEKAVTRADDFLKIYPKSPYADYARYMKGVIAYSRDVSVVDKIIPSSIAQSDPEKLKEAFNEFSSLSNTSPNSEYAEDARQRMAFLRNVIAEHEIYVAEYYIRRGAYLAAANRGRYVLENYSKTASVPLALGVMIKSYEEMGMNKLAADSREVLNLNFPNEAETNDRLARILSGNVRKSNSLWSRITEKLVN